MCVDVYLPKNLKRLKIRTQIDDIVAGPEMLSQRSVQANSSFKFAQNIASSRCSAYVLLLLYLTSVGRTTRCFLLVPLLSVFFL